MSLPAGNVASLRPGLRRSAGFTLIEVMVVVVIVAVMGGISMLALQQALARPLSGQAEQLQAWLDALAERAVLQGLTYGVRPTQQHWQPVVYYRGQWLPLAEPAPFSLTEQLELVLMPAAYTTNNDDESLPLLILSAAGMEPSNFRLQQAETGQARFEFNWQADEQQLVWRNLQGGAG